LKILRYSFRKQNVLLTSPAVYTLYKPVGPTVLTVGCSRLRAHYPVH